MVKLVDGVLPEFIEHIEPKSKKWLVSLFLYVKNTTILFKLWNEAIVIVILKSGKSGNNQ